MFNSPVSSGRPRTYRGLSYHIRPGLD
ncbi:hypothetical protein CT19425_U580013 [Cupriavidus taiwanensis]|uniref:Uncharacterized protein n=1 Tax=Cupriavidus taiwanensis TaxID=164546 RepID=A0A375IAS6_9BURK|nr:hypothetical protein CT19425_U580013 [Cupriavidus taiwanensis]